MSELVISVLVPLGDAQGRMRGEERGTFRRMRRRVYGVQGTLGRRTGEVIWRRWPYPVREHGPGRWSLGFYPFAVSAARLVRIPPDPGQTRGVYRSLTFYAVRHRVGVRREVLGYVAWRGRMRSVGRGRSGLELLAPRRRRPTG